MYTWKLKPQHISPPFLLITESRRYDHCCRSYMRVELQISLLRCRLSGNRCWPASTVGLPHAAWNILIFVGFTWQQMLRQRKWPHYPQAQRRYLFVLDLEEGGMINIHNVNTQDSLRKHPRLIAGHVNHPATIKLINDFKVFIFLHIFPELWLQGMTRD